MRSDDGTTSPETVSADKDIIEPQRSLRRNNTEGQRSRQGGDRQLKDTVIDLEEMGVEHCTDVHKTDRYDNEESIYSGEAPPGSLGEKYIP